MLSRGKVTPATVAYYADEVAAGLEDYYAGRGEAAGYWIGAGSKAEGLSGEVPAEQLARLFEACHPLTGEFLGVPYKVRDGADRVTGWDLTFSAPKSVSALWAVGGGEVGMAARDAHDAAVAIGIAALEAHAAFSRTGKAGIRQVDTQGFMAAAFVHRTSRAGDPQLHTHVLVSGRVRCADGVWRALDSRALHRELKTAGMIYHAALRAELTNRLGVEWDQPNRHGQAEVGGVPDGLRAHYSKRRTAVEAAARESIAESEAELGRALIPAERRRAYERAALVTRHTKAHDPASTQGLHDRWAADAVTAGFDPKDWLADTVGRDIGRDLDRCIDADAIVAEALEELARTRSTWGRTDVARQVARRLGPGPRHAADALAWVDYLSDAVLEHPSVVALAAPTLTAPEALCRRDGRSVFEPHGAPRYSTLDVLRNEQAVLDAFTNGRSVNRAVADEAAVEASIAERELSDDQAEALRRLTLDGDAICCLVGPAGTGKSRTVGAAAQAWIASGIAVRGLAVSAAAAGVLAAEADIAAETLSKLLFENDRPGGLEAAYALAPGEVVLVDEAGMAPSADLARLVMLATEAQAKVVLVGDYRQLGAVEAGGLFRLLAADGAAELSSARRFEADWERQASLRLRDGDPGVIDDYQAHGRIVGGEREAVIKEAFFRWATARAAGESVVVCASDHATVDALAMRARAARVAVGEIDPDGVVAGRHVVGVGDEVVTTRNDRTLVTDRGAWVRNGDRWVVTARGGDGALAVSDLSGRGRVVLPADYVASEVALAYAVTVHKAQGLTVDRAVVVVDDASTAESLYVGMTRGRRSNFALAVCESSGIEHGFQTEAAAPTDMVRSALGRVCSEQAAIEALRHALAASESLTTLAPRLANVAAQIAREMPPDRSAELERLRSGRQRAESRLHPGWLSASGRADQHQIDKLDAELAQVSAAQERRQEWLATNAQVLAYRDELKAAVADRRHELGFQAAITQSAHLVQLLGPIPESREGIGRWRRFAEDIEAYREEWSVEPDKVGEYPLDGAQHECFVGWKRVIDMDRRLQELTERALQPELDRGLEVDMGMGL